MGKHQIIIKTGIKENYLECKKISDMFGETTMTEKIFNSLAINNQVMIGEIDKRIIGFITYKTLRNKTMFIQFLRVHPEYNRKGIATKLLKKLENIAKRKNYEEIMSTVTSDNIPSIGLHKKYGFKVKGKISFSSGIEIVFIKELT